MTRPANSCPMVAPTKFAGTVYMRKNSYFYTTDHMCIWKSSKPFQTVWGSALPPSFQQRCESPAYDLSVFLRTELSLLHWWNKVQVFWSDVWDYSPTHN